MYKPLWSQILIKAKDKDKQTAGGLLIPETGRDEAVVDGEVLSVGPDVKVVKVGDNILFKRFAMDEVKIEETTYSFVNEEYILAIKE